MFVSLFGSVLRFNNCLHYSASFDEKIVFCVVVFFGLVLLYKRVIIIGFEMNRAKKGDVWDKPVK